MIIAVILIGGSGKRFGSSLPKQFTRVNGKDMFVFATEEFQKNKLVDNILIVYPKGWRNYVTQQCEAFHLSKVIHLVEGGDTRQASGYNAVKYLIQQGYDNPMILEHDGDRVLIDQRIIDNCIACCRKNGNAWPGIMSTDYVVEGSLQAIEGNLKTKIKRNTLRTHTPCAFYLNDLYKIHQYAEKNCITDMCTACDTALDMGMTIYPVPSTTQNGIKLVTQEDFEIIKLILANRQNKQIIS